jgi:AP-3 complex subunit beta
LKDDLIPPLQLLLGDKVPSVLSCALSAWEHMCPERTDLLHSSYRQICRLLVEMDEWGQLVAMRVLTLYVRRCFDKPVEPNAGTNANQFYDDTANNNSTLDPDLVLLYKCAMQLISSRSSAVYSWLISH